MPILFMSEKADLFSKKKGPQPGIDDYHDYCEKCPGERICVYGYTANMGNEEGRNVIAVPDFYSSIDTQKKKAAQNKFSYRGKL